MKENTRPYQVLITLSVAEMDALTQGYAAERELCMRGGKRFSRERYPKRDQGAQLEPVRAAYIRRAIETACAESLRLLEEKHRISPVPVQMALGDAK